MGAVEVCDAQDNDCDEEIDEDGDSTWYVDEDGDDYGSDSRTKVSCEKPNCSMKLGLVTPRPMLACARPPMGMNFCDAVTRYVSSSLNGSLKSCRTVVSGGERVRVGTIGSLEEILDNAVKFSPQGGTITLAVQSTSRQNGDERRRRSRSVEVTVSDEGIGIPEEDVAKIFSDFHQLDGSETRSYGGLGLGLAFVRRIVEAHDGSVSVESEVDQGTRLKVSLPAAKPSKDEAE